MIYMKNNKLVQREKHKKRKEHNPKKGNKTRKIVKIITHNLNEIICIYEIVTSVQKYFVIQRVFSTRYNVRTEY